MRIKVAFLFFWILGLLCFVVPIYDLFSMENRLFIRGINNFFLRNSMYLFFVSIGSVLILAPILMTKGIVSKDYFNDTDSNKGKTEIIVLSLSLPSLIFLSIAAFYIGGGVKLLLVLVLLFAGAYLSSFIKVMGSKK